LDILFFFRALRGARPTPMGSLQLASEIRGPVQLDEVSLEYPRSPSSVTKCPPRVPEHWRNERPISWTISQSHRFLCMLNF
jgi:hypothetical protein